MEIKSKNIYDFVKNEMVELCGLTGKKAKFIGQIAARNFSLQNERVPDYEEKDFENYDEWIDCLMFFFPVPESHRVMQEHIHNLFKWIVLRQRQLHKNKDSTEELRTLEAQNNFTKSELEFAETQAAIYWNG